MIPTKARVAFAYGHQSIRLRIRQGRKKTALMMLNKAVFAPMPSASVSTATAVKPGFFSSWRKANLRSFIVYDLRIRSFTSQSLHWIDVCRAPRGQPAGYQGDSHEKH